MNEPKRYYIVSHSEVQIHHCLIVSGVQISPSVIAHEASWPEDKRQIVKKPNWYTERKEAEDYIRKQIYEKGIRKFKEAFRRKDTWNVRPGILKAIDNLKEKMNQPVQWQEFSFETPEAFEEYMKEIRKKEAESRKN